MKTEAKVGLVVVSLFVLAFVLHHFGRSGGWEGMISGPGAMYPPPADGPGVADAVKGAVGSVGGNMNPADLLPQDGGLGPAWSSVNPASQYQIKNASFLSAGQHIGVNSIGQSRRNASLDIRAELPNPKANVSPWNNPTIEGHDQYYRGLGDVGTPA